MGLDRLFTRSHGLYFLRDGNKIHGNALVEAENQCPEREEKMNFP